MMQDIDTTLKAGSGPSQLLSSRIKIDAIDRLKVVLDETGETPSELIRRLVTVHLDAMTYTCPSVSVGC
jgi:hypothetical protein